MIDNYAKKGEHTSYVWYLGGCWRYAGNPDHRGWPMLVNLKDDSLGISADPAKIRNCTFAEIDAINYFTAKEIYQNVAKPNQPTN